MSSLQDYRAAAGRVPDEEVFTDILIRIADGEHLKNILRDEGMPSPAAFHRWVNTNKSWMEAYLDAQAAKMHSLAEETIEISDNIHPKLVKKAELQVKSRQWIVERLARKHFSDPARGGTVQVGNMTINNNTIHGLLTKGTEMSHIVDVVPSHGGEIENKTEEHGNAQGKEISGN